VEPLALLAALERLGPLGADVIDIGSGAGFPGVPIKIVRPELRLTLLEANGKRAAFLERLVQRLGLENVTIVNRRAEEAARDSEHREAYDLAPGGGAPTRPGRWRCHWRRAGGAEGCPAEITKLVRPGGLRRYSGVRRRAGRPGSGDVPDACRDSEEVAYAGPVSPPAGYTCQAPFALIDKKLT
jgi:hypothetical protein